MEYKIEKFKDHMSEQDIDNMILFLILQPNTTNELYAFSYECLYHYAETTEKNHLFLLLGDLLDANMYGLRGYDSFERRFEYYIKSRNINRICSILLLIHQKIHDRLLKEKVERSIVDLFKEKLTYEIGDFKFLLSYSTVGTTVPLSPSFINFKFQEGTSESKREKELQEVYDEMMMQARAAEMTSENARNDIVRVKWTNDFTYLRRISLIECSKAFSVLTDLGYDDLLLAEFTAASILQEAKCKKISFRIKFEYYDSEIFPMILYYLFHETKLNEKKIISHIHDCLLQLYNQANRLRHKQVEGLEQDADYSKQVEYIESKGKEFSIFFRNDYLFYKTYRFLFDRNISNLGKLFSNACLEEVVGNFAGKTREDLHKVDLKQYTLIWKIIFAQGNFKELQMVLLRYIMLRGGSNSNEAIMLTSFIQKAYESLGSFDSHFMFLYSFVNSQLHPIPEDDGMQDAVVSYALNNVESKVYRKFLDTLPEFDEFAAQAFSNPAAQVKPQNPTLYYNQYFPTNDLCSFEHRLKKPADQFFEDFVEYPLKQWLEAMETKLTHTEISIKEPKGIKILTDDFYSVLNANVGLGTKANDDGEVLDLNIPRFNLKSTLIVGEEFTTYYQLKLFMDMVKNQKNIRLFKADEFDMTKPFQGCPEYLRLEGIEAFEGVIKATQQSVVVFKVRVKLQEQLKQISENLEFMNMYSPLVIKFLGLFFEDDLKSDSMDLCFITDYWVTDLNKYVLQNFPPNIKEVSPKQFLLIYRCVYLLHSLKFIGLPPPIISPYHICVGKEGFPVFLIPFFSVFYVSPKGYYEYLHKSNQVTELHYYLCQAPDNIAEYGSLAMQMKSTQKYKLSSLIKSEPHWKELHEYNSNVLLKIIYFILTSQIPIFQTKPTTVANLLPILRNNVKNIPVLVKALGNIKKKTPQAYKATVDLITNLITKSEKINWQELLTSLEVALPPENLMSNSMSYNMDVLFSTYFADDQTTSMFDAPIRRGVFLPCKLVFNGYFNKSYIESARYYYGNNLISTITFNQGDKSSYSFDFFLDENRTILVKVLRGTIMEANFYAKAGQLTDKSAAEKTVQMNRFFDNSWMPSEAYWMSFISPFIKTDPEECK